MVRINYRTKHSGGVVRTEEDLTEMWIEGDWTERINKIWFNGQSLPTYIRQTFWKFGKELMKMIDDEIAGSVEGGDISVEGGDISVEGGDKPRVTKAQLDMTYACRMDIDGNPCSLSKLCRLEPEWAANRIRVQEDVMERRAEEIDRLDDEVKRVKTQYDDLLMEYEKSTKRKLADRVELLEYRYQQVIDHMRLVGLARADRAIDTDIPFWSLADTADGGLQFDSWDEAIMAYVQSAPYETWDDDVIVYGYRSSADGPKVAVTKMVNLHQWCVVHGKIPAGWRSNNS